MSLGNDPSRVTSRVDVEAGERLAEARQARHEVGRDGPAPSVEAILREMGRGADGRPIEAGPDRFVPASTAARRALSTDVEEDAVAYHETADGWRCEDCEGGPE